MSVNQSETEKELIFSVPWGHVAAKSWNDSTGIPVLLLHGILDNAGTWDQIVPLLPKSYYFVAIDFPGHGKSSHFPEGLPCKFFDFMLTIEYVVEQLNWDKFIYMGHSFGGYIGYFYCAIFPKRVERFIAVDGGIYIFSNNKCADHITNAYHSLKRVERRLKSSKAPEYAFEDAVKRIRAAHDEPLNEQGARSLAKRCLVKTSGGGYRFSMDQRIKAYEHARMGVEQCIEMLRRIQCPVWTVVGNQSLDANRSDWGPFEFIKTMLKETLAEYRYIIINGNHNAILNHPDRVGKVINEFLLGKRSQL